MSHLEFSFYDYSESGKTRIWDVYNTTTDESIGAIRWAGNFRKYAFFSRPNIMYDANCLKDIAKFLDKEMEARNTND